MTSGEPKGTRNGHDAVVAFPRAWNRLGSDGVLKLLGSETRYAFQWPVSG